MTQQQTSLTLEEAPSNGKAEAMEIKATGKGRPVNRPKKLVPVNMSGFVPVEFNVVIFPDGAEDTIKTESGVKIYKPIDLVDKEEHACQTGVLIATSPLAFTYDNWPDGARIPKPGDRVIFGKYSGFKSRGKDGKDYRLAKDKDIIAILD